MLTDVHVHLAALPTKHNGCLASRKMLERLLTRWVARRLGLPLDDPEQANRLYLEGLGAELSSSRRVSKAVLLALDGVYDDSGRLDEARTDFLISNDAVLKAAAACPRLLAGVSINPRRRDAVTELQRCAAQGARLVKVLPNTQGFDPADKRHLPFYAELARLRLPVLTHVGYEFSLIGQEQSFGDLSRWQSALEAGVPLIAAHGCSSGLFFYEKNFRAMEEFARRYAHFYVDTSALTLPNRVDALLRLRRRP